MTGWKKLHEKLHNLYSSPDVMIDQIKEDDMDEICSTCGRVKK